MGVALLVDAFNYSVVSTVQNCLRLRRPQGLLIFNSMRFHCVRPRYFLIESNHPKKVIVDSFSLLTNDQNSSRHPYGKSGSSSNCYCSLRHFGLKLLSLVTISNQMRGLVIISLSKVKLDFLYTKSYCAFFQNESLKKRFHTIYEIIIHSYVPQGAQVRLTGYIAIRNLFGFLCFITKKKPKNVQY